MRSAQASYLAGALAVGFSKIASAGAGLAGLWFLTQILSRAEFGGYAFAMSVVMLLSLFGTFGFERVLMLRIAGSPPRPGTLRGTGLLRKTMVLGLGLSLLLAAGLWAAAEPIVALGALPEATFWLGALAIAIVPMTISALMQVWFTANHRVAEAVGLSGLVDATRASFLGLVFLAGGAPAHVAAAVAAAACLPLVVLSLRARGDRRRAPHRLAASDFSYGLMFLVQRVSVQGMRQLDLVLMGFLALSTATADYAVAARIAALCDIGRLSLKPTFTPRVRRYLSLGQPERARGEYHSARLIGMMVAMAGAAAFAAVGPILLGLFGNYQGAYAPLVVLAAGYIVNAGTGMHASYLAMSGEVLLSALLRATGLGLFVAMFVWLVPQHGALGAAFGLLVTIITINAASLWLLYWRTGFNGLPWQSFIVLFCSTGAICMTGLGHLPGSTLAGILAGLVLAVFALEPRSRMILADGLRVVRFA